MLAAAGHNNDMNVSGVLLMIKAAWTILPFPSVRACLRTALLLSFLLAPLNAGSAADYRVEELKEPAPQAALGDSILKQLDSSGVQVIRGSSRVVCKIWLCRQVNGSKPSSDAYPLEIGGLVGVIEYTRKGGDFRDQEIPPGVYTMRYASIPTDGAHEGVSPTSDFLLLVSADADKDPAPIELETLVEKSAETADSSHPAILALKKPVAKDPPAIDHDEENDWWLLQLKTKSKQGDKVTDLPLRFVIVGYSEE